MDRERSPGRDLEGLYNAHGRSIAAHCARLLGDSASGEDAAQEVFLRVCRHTGSWPEPTGLRSWLFRIATNHCLNELRHRNVRARTPPQLELPLTRNLEDCLAARNEGRWLLQQLPPRVREIAWLIHIDGVPQEKVAELLGISRRTVVSCLRQMRHIICRAG
ncbi:MAG TPA: sigma-70 family RNA polymerase sigma factor [Polyangiaceae bacterium]|nr:sigma-70 family RNA polymerase sigma factor [Polyangiaceae bacterium]